VVVAAIPALTMGTTEAEEVSTTIATKVVVDGGGYSKEISITTQY
jgi:hypothetical protein